VYSTFRALSSCMPGTLRRHLRGSVLQVDYIRVYQRKDAVDIGCDSPAWPSQVRRCVSATAASRHGLGYS
jgi:hypothetical protein